MHGGPTAFERPLATVPVLVHVFVERQLAALPGAPRLRLQGGYATSDERRRDTEGHGSCPLHGSVGSGPEGDCTVPLRTVPRPGNLGAFRAPARSRCAGAATPRAQQEGRGAPLFQSPCRARSTRDLASRETPAQGPRHQPARHPKPRVRPPGRLNAYVIAYPLTGFQFRSECGPRERRRALRSLSSSNRCDTLAIASPGIHSRDPIATERPRIWPW